MTDQPDIAAFLLARQCNVGGCDREDVRVRDMCGKHYRYWLDHTPLDQRPPPPRFSRQFWDYVNKTETCWVWTGPVNEGGYGAWSNRRERGLAHRVSWERAHGPITDGLWVLHHCDNPPCVNPAHLYLGTVVENVRDAVERGRIYRPPASEVCPAGHRIEGDNLRVVNCSRQGPKRTCRTCDNARSRERQMAKRTAEDPGPPPGRLSTNQIMGQYGVPRETVFSWRRSGKLSDVVKYRHDNWWLESEVEAAMTSYRRLRSA